MPTLAGKTLFITGASRGIGLAIALRAARDGANVVVAAKTVEPDPRLPGTIHTAVEQVNLAGGRGLACVCDVRFEEQIRSAVQRTVETFGGIDILVNNASALFLARTLDTPAKRFDLIHAINVRGTFLTSQACLPHLSKATNPHILNLAPPLNLEARWFAPHLAYSLSKFGMSLCVLGMAEEFRRSGIAVNALWPRTAIATAAVRNLLGGDEACAGVASQRLLPMRLTRSSRTPVANARAISFSTRMCCAIAASAICRATRSIRQRNCCLTSLFEPDMEKAHARSSELRHPCLLSPPWCRGGAQSG